MFPSLPHTEEDLRVMLQAVGVRSLEDLFQDVPEALRLRGELPLDKGLPENAVLGRLSELARRNRTECVSFLGCGSYDHLIPAVVAQLVGRSEFYTAYTPYQAEMSQGILQAIFEFQSLMCELTALEVSNASLYDGHTAVCEAASLALSSVRRSDQVLYSRTLHPFTQQVLRTHFAHLDVELVEVAERDGITDREDLSAKLGPRVAAVILQSPNRWGWIEELGPLEGEGPELASLVHDSGSLLVIAANPISLGVLRPPGQWGADVAVGDVQPFGLPSYFGGPSAGYITAREGLLRKMPGRIVGQSLDRQGRRAFLLTLQAREQHIKRERATSNICSNQALAALAATVYLAAVGGAGIREAAGQCLQKAHYLYGRLLEEIPALRPLHDQPFFNEFTITLPREPAGVLAAMEEEGFYAGVNPADLTPADRGAAGDRAADAALTVAVTEARTRAEMDRYVEALRRVLR
ncbi:MAG: aminomethyl-transferring glycine dehydrogenase subunit GcvPA [Spirochaetales bacterium]|nr:aminomethyl-transferring glycine dehydrogenase subunit GcvPA [Spirochaetales bacterium]